MSSQKRLIAIVAWTAILGASLPKIILQEVFKYPVSETLQVSIAAGVGTLGLLLAFLWADLRPLRQFFGLFLALIGTEWLVYTRLDLLPAYRTWLDNPSFNVYMLAEQSLRLGTRDGETWRTFGRNFAFFLSLGTLAFLVIAGRPPLDIAVKALPFIPAVLLAAALNAFNEEMTYKASFLSVLEDAAGRNQALLLMAAYFGIGHYYGIPYGIVGVAMATFLGWLLGKSMLETRGFAWAWFLHFLQDVLIFSFLAIGSVMPGGG